MRAPRLAIAVAVALFVGGSTALLAALAGGSDREGRGLSDVVECSTRRLDFKCFAERSRDLVERSGVAAAFVDLKVKYRRDGFVRSVCHYLTHVIGNAATERYRFVSTAFAHGDDFCSAGYYHGVMEGVLAEMGSVKMRAEANNLCAELRERERHSKQHRNCAHGLGHGFMGLLGNELFDSLRTCDVLKDSWERRACYGGTFMENVMTTDHSGKPSKYLSSDRPLYPCTVVADRYKDACYLKQTAYALLTRGNDFRRTFDLCASVKVGHRAACFQGLGTNAAGHSISVIHSSEARASSAARLCRMGRQNGAQSNCLLGAVRTFIHYFPDDEQAERFCALVPANQRARCIREVKTHYEVAVAD